jgi:O-antigen/teichoic acid export membrane protein
VYKRLRLLLRLFQSHVLDKRERLIHWFWLLIGFFLSQVAIQIMGFTCGLVIVRSLSKDDYAIYTIVMTMGPVLTMLSDTGIGVGLGAIGRKIWQDDERMGALVQTGLGMRRLFAMVSFLIVAPILLWMLLRNHATLGLSLIMLALVFSGTWFQLSGSIMRMVVELRQQIAFLRNVGLATALLRFVLVVSFSYLFFINTALAVLFGACATALDAVMLTGFVRKQVKGNAAPDPEYKSSVYSMVRRTAPLTIYYCLQSQISIWLISIFGSSHQVADLGAVSRLGVIFGLVGSVYGSILVPRFARNNGRRKLRIQFFQILILHLIMAFSIVVLVGLFPQPLLWLLGPKYYGLGNLLWMVMLSNGLGSFLGLTCGLNGSKGWIPPAWISIPMEVLTQIILLSTLDLSKTQNVILFSILSVIPPTIFTIIVTLRYIAKEEEA